ncbi:MAG: hypothetical protein M3R15_24900, partial [Acidobacteriota bacterium]|nr:hypothetical protein [Acidobacteriota bacterium]
MDKVEYESLDEKVSAFDADGAIRQFKIVWCNAHGKSFGEQSASEEIDRAFREIPFIAAFLRAAEGFTDGLPIHYPRAREKGQSGHPPPSPEGESFKWFVANARTTNQGVRHGHRLPDLA